MADPPPRPPTVFLSHSRNDPDATRLLRAAIERAGPKVFKDDKSTRAGELWLNRLQDAIERCGAFVVLVGRDGVRRWIGAEVQVALRRSIGGHDDAARLPIFPVLLAGTDPATLPSFLQAYQATPWTGTDKLPESLIAAIRDHTLLPVGTVRFEGCPFVGLAAYRPDQANLFFGRQRETLDALACFDSLRTGRTMRWLEISGNSGSGKSSLMNAGLLPLIDQGWLWPRTGFAHWRRIGPMMPGEHPVAMLAEHLARSFGEEMADVEERLNKPDDRALAKWLRTRKPDEDTAFLLAIDQFEELFTFADPAERGRFDRLLAAALDDPDCPLFVLSTVRADFIDRYEDLPCLVGVRNRVGKTWTLGAIGEDGLREVITGPAWLAGLDVREVETAILAEARDEPGALPLVENALYWLWQKREDSRLSGRELTDMGGIAGILSRGADDLLKDLEPRACERALELLFRLVKVDLEGSRHSRRRIAHAEAVAVAGGGEAGRAVVARLAGQRRPDGSPASGPLRLITVTEDGADGSATRWVYLIHETLIRSKPDAAGKPQPYWATLWDYIERHKVWSALRDQLQADMRTWYAKQKAPGYLWSHERVGEVASVLRDVRAEVVLGEDEKEFLGPIEAPAVLAEIEHPDTSHRRRAFLGERLDVLGDSRPGIGVKCDGTPDIEWCNVPGGVVIGEVRSDPNNPYSEVTDRLVRTVGRFRIARYPVTAAQYRAFLEGPDGWANLAWWADDLCRDPHANRYDVGRFGNHPAVFVNWFDAMAFCRWLSRRRRGAVRLSDEWEWQQAATGGEAGNVFPWGAHWDSAREPHRANTFESRLGTATAVGLYPAGASPEGVVDMAGNIWEWCVNEYDRPEATRSCQGHLDARVLRGGSWDNDQGSARSVIRFRCKPTSRSYDIGFRVVCSSPFAGR